MDKLADVFYNVASKFQEKTAVSCEGRKVTYKYLSELVSQCSNFFLENGIKYGERIGVPMNNSIESIVLMLTAANIGVALVPINPTMPMDAIKKSFISSDVTHIVARRSFLDKMLKEDCYNVDGLNICIDDDYKNTLSLKDMENKSKKRPIVKNISGEESFIITMTSGSTGNPKPINLTQNNKMSRAKAHINLYKLTNEDKILAATPLYHSLAERLVIMPLLLGATSVLLQRFTPDIWMKTIESENVTFTIAVSAQLNQISDKILNSDKVNINSLRCLVSSSSLLEEDVKEKLIQNLKCEFHEMYGTSETSTVTDINFYDMKNKAKSVGKPLEDVSIKIIKDNGEEATVNEVGEIACKTPLICNGYYKMNNVFENSKSNDYFKTGDIGYLDIDGFLYFVSRKKDIIITGGINVYPTDVDECVSKIEEVKECAAFSYPDKKLGEIVCIAVVLKDGATLNKRAIQVKCAKALADYQQPRQIFFLDELPKNSMGKLVRNRILDVVMEK